MTQSGDDSVVQAVDRAVEAQRMELVEHADAIRDAGVYGVGWIKYVWDHKTGRAKPVRVHPEQVRIASTFGGSIL